MDNVITFTFQFSVYELLGWAFFFGGLVAVLCGWAAHEFKLIDFIKSKL